MSGAHPASAADGPESEEVKVDAKRLHRILTSTHALPGKLYVCT
jgi:hypothetical protein